MVYATLADLYQYGLPQAALGTISSDAQTAELAAASDDVDMRFGGRYPLPLLSWPVAITRYTCIIAAYNIVAVRGYNPAAASDEEFQKRYDRVLRDLELIQKGQLHPQVTYAPPSPNSAYEQPTVMTSSVVDVGTGRTCETRGW